MHYYLIENVHHPALDLIQPLEVSIERGADSLIVFYLNIGTQELVRMGAGETFGEAKSQFYETLSWVLNAFSENPNSYARSKDFGDLYKYYKLHFKKKKSPSKRKKA